ncbi:MAG TPA: 16S rRNA (cytosine(967)-C(5))-methyltransferase RsmB, partial [Ottowia sp.]|nr:16S rRNA (cytosine(967)-C(5))-methyltransferase RsmB [Ottowia sp.]
RLGLHADVRVADAADVPSWWQGERYDAILLDAPCSASGIVSRHPDVRWLRRESDLAQLAARQDRLLQALWPLLRPGGQLLYCTCSVFAQEGRERIESFLARHSDALPCPSPGHILPSAAGLAPGLGDNAACEDGFYYALLRKRLD